LGLLLLYFSLILREEHRQKVFEKRVFRRIFEPKRDEVTGGWSKLHNEELHNLYSSLSIIRMIETKSMRWAGNVARMVEMRNAYRISFGKPYEERPLGGPRRRWENDIKMEFREIGYGGMDWIYLALGSVAALFVTASSGREIRLVSGRVDWP
jgi:hypothetical protein